jgi:hypothetical protein
LPRWIESDLPRAWTRNGHTTIELEVLRVWKGPRSAGRVVFTGESALSCGLTIAEGEEWIVYAHGYGRRAPFWASVCSRSGLFTKRVADLAVLGPGVEPDPPHRRGWPALAAVVLGGALVAAVLWARERSGSRRSSGGSALLPSSRLRDGERGTRLRRRERPAREERMP